VADGYRQGWWRNDVGALKAVAVASAAAPTRWQDGFLLDANNALVIAPGVAGAFAGGYLRTAAGALCTVDPGAGPFRWQDGEYLDSTGALVTAAYPAAGQAYNQGMLRTPAGALVIA
jgi:hypothetical protein